jgi:conjugal transfer pilus assembly protein TraB
MADKKSFKWNELPQNTRTAIAIGGLLAVVLTASQLMKSEPAPIPGQKTSDQQVNFTNPNRANVTVEELAGRISSLSDRVGKAEKISHDVDDIKQMMFEQQNRLKSQNESTWKAEEMVSEITRLKSQIDEIQKKGVVTSTPAKVETPSATEKKISADDVDLSAPIAKEEVTKPAMRWIADEKKPAESNKKELSPEDEGLLDQLMAGGMFSGVLLTGMDAPTSGVAKSNPMPALIRVKSDAVLPNFYQSAIKECFIIASGYGVLSSERALMRTEKLSCVAEGGKTIEKKIDGYIVGEDGKAGLRGRVVSKQGQFIAKTLTAGFLEGVSRALQPYQTPVLNIGAGSQMQYQTPNPEMVGQKGIYGGIAGAASQVSKFYLDMAKEMFPVIEIDANRHLTVVMLNGTSVSQDDDKE